MKVLLLSVVVMIMMPGCVSRDSAFRALHPGTWFSGREADRVDRSIEDLESAERLSLQSARAEVAKASQALSAADHTQLPVQLSRRFVDNALPLLDQIAGPMSAEEAAELRKLVGGLLAGKAEAETAQRAAEGRAAKISAELEAAQAALAKANEQLRAGFARENRLADQYRAEKALRWILIGLLVIAAGGVAYLRMQFAGLGGGLASALADMSRKAGVSDLINAIDVNISPAQQRYIRKRRLAALEHQ